MKAALQFVLKHFGYRVEKLRPTLPGESIFLLDLALYILNQHRHGDVRFVQIGANDGLQEDPCHAWINKFPWQGVLVEPQPNLAEKLREMYRSRKGISVEEAVIADQPIAQDFYFLRQIPGIPDWASGIASLDLESISAHRDKFPNFDSALSKISVQGLTLSGLLEKHNIEQLDFLQIDAEGYDAKILATIDFHQIKPPVISYEHCNLSFEDQIQSRKLLMREGYLLATWHGDTLACLPNLLPVSADREIYTEPFSS